MTIVDIRVNHSLILSTLFASKGMAEWTQGVDPAQKTAKLDLGED